MHSISKPTKLAEHSAPPLLFPFLDLKAEYALMKEEIRAAVDKVLGWAVLEGRIPLNEQLLVVSGRSSYEILQKAVTAGVPIVCAVSAPSSLAVDVARAFGVTLVGFLRAGRFNVYTGEERIALASG